MKKILKILNEQGLHARSASMFVKTAYKFQSTISIVHANRVANAKSIINVISLGITKGEEIKIIAEGTDEKEAMDVLVSLVGNRIGEIEEGDFNMI